MAEITNELEDILTAILGEEVRQSIYRGMVKVNGQAERLEDVVGALNDAITAETSTNVRSFVEKVENAVWYKDGDEVVFEDCENDFFLIPTIFTFTMETAWFSFTIDLPKCLKPSETGYAVSIDDLTCNVRTIGGMVYKPWNTELPIVANGVPRSGVSECAGYVESGCNKLHIIIVISGLDNTPENFILFFNITKLGFTITENSPE